MLEQALKDQVKSLFSGLKHKYTLLLNVADAHSSRADMLSLIEDVASCSEHVSTTIMLGDSLTLTILKDEKPTHITFRAVPTGHEFSSLLLAILNLDGIGKNLPDEGISHKIKSLKGNVEIKSYISLTCTNCPEVVQALNVITMLNPNIKHQIIDGSINKEEVEDLGIQAVPSIYANGEQLHVGRSSLGELLGKLEALVGTVPQETDTTPKSYDVVVVGGRSCGSFVGHLFGSKRVFGCHCGG